MNEQIESEAWTVDPGASLQSVLDEPSCPPLVGRALTGVHSWQLRNETSVDRTLRASQRVPQWIAALLALRATLTLEDDDGAEEVPLDVYVKKDVEGKVMALHVPMLGANTVWGEAHVARTPSDDPIVAAFAVLTMSGEAVEQARVALTGVWPEAVRLSDAADLLIGKSLSSDRIADVAAAIEDEVEPVGDYLGSEAYRRAMAGVLACRALEMCLEQEVGNE
jgi:CO/xanthine dehydrogenase FAD-binding subunit